MQPATASTPPTIARRGGRSPSSQNAMGMARSGAVAAMGSTTPLGGANTKRPFFTADKTGTYIASLIVSNGIAAASLPATVTITAGKCGTNKPVVATTAASPDKVTPGVTVALSAKVTDDDIDTCKLPRTLSYQWKITKSPAGSSAPLLGATTLTPSFIPDRAGDYEITLIATDDLGRASVPKAQPVTVSGCDTAAPVVTEIKPNPLTPNVGTPVQLTATITDADTEPMCGLTESFTYAWSLLEIPLASKASLNVAGAANPSFTPDVPGDYLVGLIASDAKGHPSAQATKKITVAVCNSNVPVIATINVNPAAPNTNKLVTLTATISDADTLDPCLQAETFSYQWVLVTTPNGSKAQLSAANTSNPTFTPDLVGDYTVSLIVADTIGHKSAAKTQKISTTQCGSTPPVALLQELFPETSAIGAPVVGKNMATGEVVQLCADSSCTKPPGIASNDPDNSAACGNLGQTLSYKWAFLELPAGSKAKLNETAVSNPSFTADVNGKYVVGLTVTDSTNLSSKTTFTVTSN